MEKENTQHYIIFDINSSSIGVLVFEKKFDKKTKKNIYHEIFTKRTNITKGQSYSVDVFLKKTLATLRSLADSAHKYSGNTIAAIYMNMSAPWVNSQKRIVHFEKGKEFTFTKEIAGSIIEKELLEPLHKTYDFREHGELEILERKTIDVFINGYPTKNPYGVLAKDVDIHSFVSAIATTTKKSFSHVIEQVFHREPEYISNMFVNYQSLISLFPHENNITSLDISGEMTEISIIVNDHLKKIGTIPVGSDTVIRHLADSLQVSYTKADSLISLYQKNILEDEYKEKIEKTMHKAFLSWFKIFYVFLDDVSKEYLIPETLSLLAAPGIQNWFNEWILKSEELGEHMHAKKSIRILDTKMLFREKNRKDLLHISDDNLSLCLFFVENSLDQK